MRTIVLMFCIFPLPSSIQIVAMDKEDKTVVKKGTSHCMANIKVKDFNDNKMGNRDNHMEMDVRRPKRHISRSGQQSNDFYVYQLCRKKNHTVVCYHQYTQTFRMQPYNIL
ncbi:hypothetical protein AMTR_s00062p00192830 [Amborella trichopoda]|uniref:Uncharacterized protein n=1 Tax=Amborella trichopoda TaxID=13333 RepID=U5DE53_AMBTC|nr:hypothetical protein AMTR_s00062p00192830 [Amborella trichopoda]